MMEPSIEKTDLEVLVPILKISKPRVILEIGMHRGYSMKFWDINFLPRFLIGVELEDFPSDAWKNGISTDYIKLFWGLNSHDEQTLEHVKQTLKGYFVDFLFIDGDHSYEGVKKDFEMYLPLVKPGGIIAFHDCIYTSPTEQVKLLWEELKTKYPYTEIRTAPNSTGIGVLWNTPIEFMENR